MIIREPVTRRNRRGEEWTEWVVTNVRNRRTTLLRRVPIGTEYLITVDDALPVLINSTEPEAMINNSPFALGIVVRPGIEEMRLRFVASGWEGQNKQDRQDKHWWTTFMNPSPELPPLTDSLALALMARWESDPSDTDQIAVLRDRLDEIDRHYFREILMLLDDQWLDVVRAATWLTEASWKLWFSLVIKRLFIPCMSGTST